MKRIWSPQLPDVGELLEPDREELRHLLSVRRASAGERIEVIDGKGGLAIGELESVRKRDAEIRIVERLEASRESPLQLTVVLALPVQISTLDDCLPGLVQLGVTRLIWVPTRYGGRMKKDPAKYQGRLQTIALQSLKQCGRLVLPVITPARDWEEACTTMTESGAFSLLFHPIRSGAGTEALPEKLDHVALWIGPEGGFSEDEVQRAAEAGARPTDMGPRILRTETAVIGACYWAQSRFGDIGHALQVPGENAVIS
ncbi:Ribosomal RNA small subunit methyltransferase E [Sulfidibacter corallicola]|uniref:Ribosomal RNA small subunit methyltransferase E n=1 Tax=Sulfidibacter corallicola TaxID=2818388 RepID=A0A8A4TNN4_SULCO|nr:16S rRNA (uracil(1498)-N(3))-methyltransferase [Sulfidibacter corallicola]QTD51589.1 16S rRNA (uracil(1498)-N(3))-methyltransferase [Sulfidibacter corallicola]